MYRERESSEWVWTNTSTVRAQNIRNKFNCSKIDLKSILNAAVPYSQVLVHEHDMFTGAHVLLFDGCGRLYASIAHYFRHYTTVTQRAFFDSVSHSFWVSRYDRTIIILNWISSVRF